MCCGCGSIWKRTSSVNSLGRAEHGVLLVRFGKLGFGVKVLPFGLASLEFFGGFDLLGLGRLGRILLCLCLLLGIWVHRGASRADNARSRRRGGHRSGGRRWRTFGLSLVGNGTDVSRPERLCVIVRLELDDVDGIGRRSSDGRDARRVESLVARDPFRQDGVVHLIVHDGFFLVLGRRRGLFEGGMVLFGPLGRLRRRRSRLLGGLGCLLRLEVGDVLVEQSNKLGQLRVQGLELDIIGVVANLAKDEIQLELELAASLGK